MNDQPVGLFPDYSKYRCGFVSILGKPNAGKSTLVNALVGEKLMAVSGLPQTTRDSIKAICSTDDYQMIFVDLPGIVEATDKLNEALRENVLDGLDGVDVVVHLIDAMEKNAVTEDTAKLIAKLTCPVVLVVNKIDRMPADFTLEKWAAAQDEHFRMEAYVSHHAISASGGAKLPELVEDLAQRMPLGPPLYDPEDLTDRDMRFLTSELIREKIFLTTHQELPYSTAVQIEQFEERQVGKWYISATIFVERDTQKGMIIGKGGSKLKRISQQARHDIEQLTGTSVYLDLFVKVAKNWRKSDFHLLEFGYKQRR